MAALLITLVIALPWLGALLVWLVRDRDENLQHSLALLFSGASGLASLVLLAFTGSEVVIRVPVGAYFGDLTFIPDGLGVFLAAVAAVIGSLAVHFSRDYMHGEAQLGRYYALVLIFIGAMAALVLTGSLFFLFIFWEITALCSYALISFDNDNPRAVAGGIKALLITSVGGLGLLAGALLVYSYLGSYEISTVLERSGELPAPALAVLAFGALIAAAAKSAQVPFQTWLPDAMEAPTPVSALIHAATMVNAGVYLLARFFPAFAPVPGWTFAVMLVGLLSALLAALMACTTYDLKRVLAYSTISQLGYMVYAIGAGSVLASQFHLFSHAVFKALLFLGAGAVIHSVGTRDMRAMGGLGQKMPFVRNVFITGALALAGLPPLNGFWSKELILEAGLHSGPVWAFALMLLVAGLTAFYTFRTVWMVFFTPSRVSEVHTVGAAMKTALAPLALAALVSGFLAGPFDALLSNSLPFHQLHAESTGALLLEVLSAPATLLALAVIAAGLAAWHFRSALTGLQALAAPLQRAASESFGFEWLNHQIVAFVQGFAGFLRRSQSGQISWNLAGIIGGLLVVLVILLWAVQV
ncbi:MAG: NADH-quinone oxidoreductase subunit L [Chloroflexi bacterium]|jgi:NADH-quinone oxidoreductase subunit L|nr:NADH-quinone oxidoreductase subunit L [Chloroflexota bacterium]